MDSSCAPQELTTVDSFYGDVMTWIPFLNYWPFVRGFHQSPVDSRHKRLVLDSATLKNVGKNIIRTLYKQLAYITVTSLWAKWRLKSPTSRLFAQPSVQAQIKENIKVQRHWPFARGIHRSPMDSSHKGQWCGNVSVWWRHHESKQTNMTPRLSSRDVF